MDTNYDLVTYNFYNNIMRVIKGYGKALPIEIASHILKQIATEYQNIYLQQVNEKLTKLTQQQNNFGNQF